MLLFLDIDGVLKTHSFSDEFGNDVVNPFLVSNLVDIVIATECDIIISSDWRFGSMQTIHDALRCTAFLDKPKNVDMLIDNIIGTTLDLDTREQEILECVGFHKPNSWIAIDDMELQLPVEHFVHIDPQIGLVQTKVQEAIKKLMQPVQIDPGTPFLG